MVAFERPHRIVFGALFHNLCSELIHVSRVADEDTEVLFTFAEVAQLAMKRDQAKDVDITVRDGRLAIMVGQDQRLSDR